MQQQVCTADAGVVLAGDLFALEASFLKLDDGADANAVVVRAPRHEADCTSQHVSANIRDR